VIDLFTCTESEITAVEVVSKGALFNVVVETDQTATKVLEFLFDQQKAGRVTFMPLNKLSVEHSQKRRQLCL